MAKVTGLGGVFVRSRDPKRLTAWYAEHLGLPVTEWGGVVFVWEQCAASEGCGCTVWSLFPADSDYFGEREQSVMLNFRVDDLDALLTELQAKGVWVDQSGRKRRTAGSHGFAMAKETALSCGSREHNKATSFRSGQILCGNRI